jgi:hypothetical protein
MNDHTPPWWLHDHPWMVPPVEKRPERLQRAIERRKRRALLWVKFVEKGALQGSQGRPFLDGTPEKP